MDDFERAAQHEEEDRRIALKQQVAGRHPLEPGDTCADCDDPLPDHRKPYGTCIECQTARELRARHYRKD